MTKLKTLKDLQKESDELSFGGYTIIDTLKQEAIKWIKDEDKLSPSARAGFMEFFNITKEDLKNA